MNEYIGELTLDIDCRKSMPRIAAGQYDKGRKYLIHITANGQPFSAQSSTVVIQGIRHNKKPYCENCSVDENGNVVLVLSESILSASGFGYAKLVLSDANKNYSTQVFIIDVDGSYEGDISDDDNYSIVNFFMNEMMALFELDEPSEMMRKVVFSKYAYDTPGTYADGVHEDLATDINVRYLVKNRNNAVIGFLYCAVAAGAPGYGVTQIKVLFDGRLLYRQHGNGGSWSDLGAEWYQIITSKTMDTDALCPSEIPNNDSHYTSSALVRRELNKRVQNSRTIAGVDLQDDITAVELQAALGFDGKANIKTTTTNSGLATAEIPFIDNATENDVLYRVIGSNARHVEGYMLFLGNIKRANTTSAVAQIRFSRTGSILSYRSGMTNPGDVETPVSWDAAWSFVEQTGNKVRAISDDSPSDDKYPTEKAVRDYVTNKLGNIESILAQV